MMNIRLDEKPLAPLGSLFLKGKTVPDVTRKIIIKVPKLAMNMSVGRGIWQRMNAEP